MEWVLMVLGCLTYCVCAYASYNDELRRQPYFVPVAIFLGTIVSTIWFMAVRYIDDRQKIYVYSLFWDLMLLSVYYFLPVAFFGVKMDKWGLLGVFIAFAGLCLVKARA
jgi:hypothetical protein